MLRGASPGPGLRHHGVGCNVQVRHKAQVGMGKVTLHAQGDVAAGGKQVARTVQKQPVAQAPVFNGLTRGRRALGQADGALGNAALAAVVVLPVDQGDLRAGSVVVVRGEVVADAQQFC